ncbi:hypothetical protein [Edaphobacter modestus]|uniref:hypothetical protein n=1 Tax=Edaphobacter modestus TaxID=388466 RepID=UPI001A9347DD|nr:hypothetical protein [Edaphobacter modestus]
MPRSDGSSIVAWRGLQITQLHVKVQQANGFPLIIAPCIRLPFFASGQTKTGAGQQNFPG